MERKALCCLWSHVLDAIATSRRQFPLGISCIQVPWRFLVFHRGLYLYKYDDGRLLTMRIIDTRCCTRLPGELTRRIELNLAHLLLAQVVVVSVWSFLQLLGVHLLRLIN